jgi:hypothetical protein
VGGRSEVRTIRGAWSLRLAKAWQGEVSSKFEVRSLKFEIVITLL